MENDTGTLQGHPRLQGVANMDHEQNEFSGIYIIMTSYKSLNNSIKSVVMREDLATKEIDPKEFPNPVPDALKKIFTRKISFFVKCQ